MRPAVIDTNILLIANAQHEDVSDDCVQACVERLLSIQKEGVVVLDDGYRILGEYQNKTQLRPPKGIGDVFLKWLLRQIGNPARVHTVPINESASGFHEFPDLALEPFFDASDRKFAAVANAHPGKPPILQGADCKWIDWWQALQAHGIDVEFLCPGDACRFYATKFPERGQPALPGN